MPKERTEKTQIGKTRLDQLLVERGLAASRERARSLILAGRVLVREQKIEKPGTSIPVDAPVRLLGNDLRLCEPGRIKAGSGSGPLAN